MSLIIPKEFKRDIDPLSGFLKYSSRYGKKTVKGLFLTPANHEYLAGELYLIITHKRFVQDIRNDYQNMHLRFTPYRQEIRDLIYDVLPEWKLPFQEDVVIKNPVQELSNINQNFLVETAKAIILDPSMLIPDFYDIDPVTGEYDAPEWAYGAASYSDGSWHPEHLFTQSKQNRKTAYWVPLNITFDCGLTNKEAPASVLNKPGNRYKSRAYGDYTNPDRNKRGLSNGGIFPPWNDFIRQYDKFADDGLREAGRSDRRFQVNRGYNMSALLNKSTY